jgi:SPP1 family predicted phage head-tail adaptor
MIQAGHLKDFVTITKPSNAADSSGQRDPTYITHVQAYAEVVQLSGKELIEARQLYSMVSTRVRLRWRDAQGVNGSMRVVVEGRTLNILSIVDVGRRRQLVEMLCVELV